MLSTCREVGGSGCRCDESRRGLRLEPGEGPDLLTPSEERHSGLPWGGAERWVSWAVRRGAPGHRWRHVQTTRQPPCSPLPLLPPPFRPRSQDLLVAPGGHLPGPDTQTAAGLASASGSQAGISPEIDSSLRGFGDSRRFQAARFQAEASQLNHDF